MLDKNIKAILFDSGKVLNGPVTGNWFITPNFFRFVDKKMYNSIPAQKKKNAFKKAGNYISEQIRIDNEMDEYSHFLEYYRIFFDGLPELNISDKQIEFVARDLVFNYDKYKFFDEIKEVISILSEFYKLAVVSDAWPSLENVFKKAGLREYFNSFIISSKLGVTKPDELMYKTTLDELGVSPEEAVFIDDNIKNCDGAKRLGIKTILVCREFRLYLLNKIICRNHKVIRNIRYLKDMSL